MAAFREAAPDLPEVDPRDLTGLRTLRAILDRLNRESPGDTKTAVSPTAPTTRAGLAAVAARDGHGRPILVSGMSVAIVGDGSGLAAPLGPLLSQAGLTVLAPGLIAAADAVIALHGLEKASQDESLVRLYLETFAAARAFASRAHDKGGSFVTVQDTGGDFGLSGGGGDRAWLGGMAGLAKQRRRNGRARSSGRSTCSAARTVRSALPSACSRRCWSRLRLARSAFEKTAAGSSSQKRSWALRCVMGRP